MEEKTFTSVELQLALKLGYEIKKYTPPWNIKNTQV